MRTPGNTDGGGMLFAIGLLLSLVSLYLFFDSVRVMTEGFGAISGAFHGYGRRGGGMMETTSMGIVFVPFFIAVIALFYDASKKWAWWLLWIGIAVVIVEILSRIRFVINTKTSLLLLMIIMFGAGAGLMLRALRPARAGKPSSGDSSNTDSDSGDAGESGK